MRLYCCTRLHTPDLICSNPISVMVCIFHCSKIFYYRSNQNFVARDLISDLPSFSASILPVLCATYGETAYICQSTIPILAKEESDSTEQNDHTLLIFAHLLYTLSISKKIFQNYLYLLLLHTDCCNCNL